MLALDRLDCVALVLGDGGPDNSAARAERLRAADPDAAILIDGIGHAPHLNQPAFWRRSSRGPIRRTAGTADGVTAPDLPAVHS